MWRKLVVTHRTKIKRLVRGLGHSTLSLSFNIGGLLAGVLLNIYFDVFSITSWALLLFPGVLSTRGAIGGVFCARLSTALHTGRIEARFTKNTRTFYLVFYAIITLTLGSGLIMGVTTSLFSIILGGTTFADSIAILAVTIGTMGLSLILIAPITIGVAILSQKRGLDPDVIVYPIMSTVADILVTICYIVILTSFFASQTGNVLIGIFIFAFSLVVCYILIKFSREKLFLKTLKEFFLTLILVTFIVNVTGLTLGKIGQVIGNRKEIYMVYPALIDTVGDVGSIVGSTATTKFALGLTEPSLSSIK